MKIGKNNTFSVIKTPVTVLLRDIYKNKLTGTLKVSGDNYKKSIFFKNGAILYAKTDLIQERLGEILFKSGKITRQEFWNIHKMIEGKSDKIGKILVANNILTEKDVFVGIRLQIKAVSLSLFTINHGQWSFEESEPDVPEDSKFNIDLGQVIIEGSEKYIRNLNFYKNQNFSKAPEYKDISKEIIDILPERTMEFYKRLTEFKNIANEEIADSMNIPEDEYWKNILSLYLLGIVDFVRIEMAEEERKNIDEVINLYERITKGEINYYEILGLEYDAKQEEIRNSYFGYAKKYHPDRMSGAPDPEIKEKVNIVFSEINRAYDTLSNSDKKREYDLSKIKNGRTDKQGRGKEFERASLLFRKAKTLFNQKNYWEATTLLEVAIKLNPGKGAYYLLLGLAQMNLPSMVRAAEKNLTKASELDPWSPEPLSALGLLFMNENMTNRAENFFRKAISIDPDNILAKKRLKELDGSSTKKSFRDSIFKKKQKK